MFVNDIFVAVVAGGTPATAATLTGTYWLGSIDFPTGDPTQTRDALFQITANGQGNIAASTATGYVGTSSAAVNQSLAAFGYTLTKSAAWTAITVVGMAVGIWLFGQLADRIGRRPVFLGYQVGAALSVLIYSQLQSEYALLIGGAIMGLFVNGMLGGYGALIAELYPTQARATAQNVLFNIGRAVGGFGPLVVGALAAKYSFSVAIALLAVLYVIDILVTLFLIPERKGVALEEVRTA